MPSSRSSGRISSSESRVHSECSVCKAATVSKQLWADGRLLVVIDLLLFAQDG